MTFQNAFSTYKHKKAVKHERGLILAIEVCSLCDVKIRSKDQSIVLDVTTVSILFPRANFDNLDLIKDHDGKVYSIRFDSRFLRRELMRAYELSDNSEITTSLTDRFGNAFR